MPRKPFLTVSLAALLALACTASASAQQQQQKHKPRKHPAHEATTTLTPRSPSHNPCAQYGAGFVRAPGSDTCVRIGGSIGVDVGGRF
ncbi:MAG: hypothetical protein EKK36_05270 [Bradyrhizobiaceae bacterium]|nr:MAG: hypothetical protein EKK36_05270 [Bradyrhizobiaceae bacterium]